MKTAVIIAEYNPFHNGHAYHIEQTRRLGATHVAVVMSGNFVQRGEPAFLEKHIRAEAALLAGADLVLELPLPFACAPAQRFAQGAVALADSLGCADLLSFGSECGDVARLQQAAALSETPAFRQALREALGRGNSYAAAQQQALHNLEEGEAAALLENPNDTLALEYIRALAQRESPLQPVAVQRRFAAHDAPEGTDTFASASALRRKAATGGVMALKQYVPETCFPFYQKAAEQGNSLDTARADLVMLSVLRSLPPEAFQHLPDSSEGVENRLYHAVQAAASTQELLTLAKTRRYTHARLRRLMVAACLGIPQELAGAGPAYLRVLGANGRGRELLSAAKGRATLPLSPSLAQLRALGGTAARFAELEARSTGLFNLMLHTPRPAGTDYTTPAVWQTGSCAPDNTLPF